MEKFKGPNYHLWKFKMKTLLKDKGLWDIVEGTRVAPEASLDSGNALKEWRKKEDKAMALIVLALGDEQLMHVQSAGTSAEAWQKLGAVHERKSLANKLYLRRQFLTVKMEEGEKMLDHINKVKVMAQQLEAIGAQVNDEDLVTTVLYSLPQSFDQLIISLEARADDLDMEFLTARLLHEETRRGQKGEDGGVAGKAFNANGIARRQQRGPKKGKCFYCGKEGHFKSDCRKMKAEMGGGGSGGSQANKASSSASSGGFAFMATHKAATREPKSIKWIIDSGASQHMTYSKDQLEDYEEMEMQSVHLADKTVLEAIGKGTATIWTRVGGNNVPCRIKNVWLVPKLERSLLSVTRIVQHGYSVIFTPQSCLITAQNGQHVLKAVDNGGIYLISSGTAQNVALMGSIKEDSHLWHRRLGHLNMDSVKQLTTRGLISASGSLRNQICEVCIDSKITRKPFPLGRATRAQEALGLVHTDVCGPMSVVSIGGASYFTIFIDDWSRATFLYLLKRKSDVLDAFKQFEAWATTTMGKKLKILRSDNGGEYISGAFNSLCLEKGIQRQFTVPYTPQQNGVAERANRTLVEMGKCLLRQANLKKRFWGEAVRTAAYLRNRCPSSALEGGKTPLELFSGQKLDLGHLRTFGCIAYAHLEAQKRDKLDSKAIKCLFIGYSDERKAYRLYNIESGRVLESRDVIFDENTFLDDLGASETSEIIEIDHDHEEDIPELIEDSEDEGDDENDGETTETRSERPQRSQQPQKRRSSLPVPTRSSNRTRNAPREWWKTSGSSGAVAYASMALQNEPRTFKEALESVEAKQWEQAIQDELESLERNNTWELVKLPAGRKPVGCKWVFKKKLGADGTVERFKARLVAKGFSQQPGMDFQDTFAPVAKFSSVRLLLSLAASQNLEIHQMDIKTAFLNGVLEEEIYMEQPEGCIAPGTENLVCRMKKSLYGLKQAPRAWNQRLDASLQRFGFKKCSSDHCMYTWNGTGNTGMVYLLVYVDDLIIATKDLETLQTVKQHLKDQFDVTDMGELKFFLGIQITRNRTERTLQLHQHHHTIRLLNAFGMQDSKPVSTPMEPGLQLVRSTSEPDEQLRTQYQSAVGGLLFIMLATRPDIAAAVGIVSQYMSNPTEQHWSAVKRIFRYLRGSATLGIQLGSSKTPQKLQCYSDSDWARCLDTRRSTTGYLTLLGGPISWQSKKQPTVALSSTEAEYLALGEAVKEVFSMKTLLGELGEAQEGPVDVLEDNQGCIALAKNPVSHARSKHIDIRHHFIRDAVEEGVINLVYCRTDEMLADILTKPLPREQFIKLRTWMGMVEQEIN